MIGRPSMTSSAAVGTRNDDPNARYGIPALPPVSRHSRVCAYAAVRPILRTRAASSTVKQSGTRDGSGFDEAASIRHLQSQVETT